MHVRACPRGARTADCSARCRTPRTARTGWVERIVGRGWGKLNLHSATALIDQGQASVNLVAAVPSLHAGLTAAVAAFLWTRVQRKWQPLLVAYVLVMAFTLVYTGRALCRRHPARLGACRGGASSAVKPASERRGKAQAVGGPGHRHITAIVRLQGNCNMKAWPDTHVVTNQVPTLENYNPATSPVLDRGADPRGRGVGPRRGHRTRRALRRPAGPALG